MISSRGCCRSHPLPSPLCPSFTLPLSGCKVFFFLFFAAIWVDLILVSNCGGWFAVEVLLRQWILMAVGCVVDVVVVDDNGGGNNILLYIILMCSEYYFNV